MANIRSKYAVGTGFGEVHLTITLNPLHSSLPNLILTSSKLATIHSLPPSSATPVHLLQACYKPFIHFL
jgi:hypothetical protein